MAVSANLIHETTTTTGTGNLTVAAVSGRVRFSDATYGFSTGGLDIFWYFVSHRTEAEWEIGTGHMSNTNTLIRDTVLFSTNSNNAVNFSAGTKDVTSDVPFGDQLLSLSDDTGPTLGGNLIINGNEIFGDLTPTSDNNRDLGTSSQRWADLYLGGSLFVGGTGAANALDDFEEGTWTPAIEGGGSNPTVTYFAQTGRYVKIGRCVIATWALAINSFSGGSGELRITIPFSAATNTSATGTGYLDGTNIDNSAVHVIGGIPISGTYGVYYEIKDTAAITTMDIADIGAFDVLGCTVSYEV